MSAYAIVKLGATQHKVSVGDKIVTDRLEKAVGDKFQVSEVYMTVDGEKVEVGMPTVNAPVEFEVVSHEKGDKVRIHKFKAKSRYKLTRGFRPYLTTLKVVSIGGQSDSTESKPAKATKPRAKKSEK